MIITGTGNDIHVLFDNVRHNENGLCYLGTGLV